MKKILLTYILIISILPGYGAWPPAGGSTPIGGGVIMLLTLSLAYAIKHYRVSKGKEEEI